MAHPLTISTAGVLALLGVGAGVHLGRSAIAEINPIYYSEAPTRFHADLSPYRSTGSAPSISLAQGGDAPIAGDCVGCRTYPEEYYPIHDASIDRYSSDYALSSDVAPAPAAAEAAEEPSPEELRLRKDIRKLELYARGGAEPAIVYASAEAEALGESQGEERPVED